MYDIDIREALFDYLDDNYGKNRILEEKVMGRSRADLIMVLPEQLIGLEIKSDADTYERLKRQIRDYDRFCDCNYIVVGRSHEKHVASHVPEWWGIFQVYMEQGQVFVEQMREAKLSPKCQISLQLRWLWRPELNHILARNHLPKYRHKSKAFVQGKILEKVSPELLKGQICDELFERDYTLWQDGFYEEP